MITYKDILAITVPAALVALFGLADGAMKWRAEIHERQTERQVQHINSIIYTANATQRRILGQFYLSSGALSGKYKKEVERELSEHPAEGNIFSYDNIY
jgi:uncharacterized heparinase superfamily protein